MVTGALARNRKKRRNYLPLEKKIKIIDIEDATFEDIHNKLNSGCLVVLTGLEESNQLVYETRWDEKIVTLAYKKPFDSSIELSNITFNNFLSPLGLTKYTLINVGYITKKSRNYYELNRRLDIINKN